MSKRVCPNSPDHKTFRTTGCVLEGWLVDERGEFIEGLDNRGEVVRGPSHDNVWTCDDCGCQETREEEEKRHTPGSRLYHPERGYYGHCTDCGGPFNAVQPGRPVLEFAEREVEMCFCIASRDDLIDALKRAAGFDVDDVNDWPGGATGPAL